MASERRRDGYGERKAHRPILAIAPSTQPRAMPRSRRAGSKTSGGGVVFTASNAPLSMKTAQPPLACGIDGRHGRARGRTKRMAGRRLAAAMKSLSQTAVAGAEFSHLQRRPFRPNAERESQPREAPRKAGYENSGSVKLARILILQVGFFRFRKLAGHFFRADQDRNPHKP
jgi:hypothetical protein